MSPTSYHAAPLRDIELFAVIFDCLFIIALGIGYVKQKINNSIKKTKRRTLQRQNRANCMKYRKCTAPNSALTISIGYYIICGKTEIMMSIWSEWIYKLYIISLYYQNYTACIIYNNGVVIDPFSKQYGIHIVYTVRKIYNLYNSLTFKLANSSMAYLTDQLIGILGIETLQ